MLYELSDFRPHSSSDPFGATFSPGEGFGSVQLSMRKHPYAKLHGDACD